MRCGFRGQSDAERVEDAGRLEDRPVTDIGPEDLRRMRRLARDRQRPCRRAAAPNDRRFRVAGPVLEPDGNVHALGGSDERRPRDVLRIARCLFVSCHHDRDVHAIQRTGGLQGLEGLDDDDVAALHVDRAWSTRAPFIEPLELLKRAIGFEDRIEVADEEKSLARPRPLCDEMPRTPKWRAIDPARGEAQRLELGAEQFAHGANAGKILGSAVDVDCALEQGQRVGVVRIDVGNERLFLAREAGLSGAGQRHQTQGDRSEHRRACEHQ